MGPLADGTWPAAPRERWLAGSLMQAEGWPGREQAHAMRESCWPVGPGGGPGVLPRQRPIEACPSPGSGGEGGRPHTDRGSVSVRGDLRNELEISESLFKSFLNLEVVE